MYLNASIPHFYCLLRSEFLYDLQEHHGEFTPVVVFGVASIPGRAVLFHVMTEGGAQIARVPIHALVHTAQAPEGSLGLLELWDCFSYHVAVTQFDFLKGLRCRVRLRDGRWYSGEYMMTIDWAESAYAEDPGEGGHKNAHLLKLEDGRFALQPNNRIIWREPSFITQPLMGNPGYKTNSHVWSAEGDGALWHTEHSDQTFYEAFLLVDLIKGLV